MMLDFFIAVYSAVYSGLLSTGLVKGVSEVLLVLCL